MAFRIVLIALVTLSFACGDLDEKPSGPNSTVNNMEADAGGTDSGGTDSGDPDGGSVDGGNVDMAGPGATFGQTCPGRPDGELASQECSLVDQDCAENTCQKRILLDEGVPSAFAVVCAGPIIDTDLVEGDPCDPAAQMCPVEMVCKRFANDPGSICRRWCRLDDGYGCAPDQFCVVSSDLEPVFGVCADSCPAG